MVKQGKIKKGLHIYLYYWTILILIVFILINYFCKDFKVANLNIGLMVSIVSFLFGFLITITFSMLLSRVSSLKDDLAAETGKIVSIFLLSKYLGERFHKKIRERIDEYTINTLRDYEHYDIGRKDIYGIYSYLKSIKIQKNNQNQIANSFLYILGEWETVREKLENLTGRRTEWSLKFADYILGIILIGLLFLNRGDLFTNLLFISLSTIIVFIFLIIEDYDNLRIGDYSYNISNSEQIFDLIGKDRYYPEDIINRVKLQKGRKYRIGFYDKKRKREEIVGARY